VWQTRGIREAGSRLRDATHSSVRAPHATIFQQMWRFGFRTETTGDWGQRLGDSRALLVLELLRLNGLETSRMREGSLCGESSLALLRSLSRFDFSI
jgi:hypothetical protein